MTSSGTEPDSYQVLGITAAASGAEVSRAWRRVARGLHPDTRPGDVRAAAQFRAALEAYQLLCDPRRRAAYDRRRKSGPADPAMAGILPARPGSPLSGGMPPRAALWAGPVDIQATALSAGHASSCAVVFPAVVVHWLLAGQPEVQPW